MICARYCSMNQALGIHSQKQWEPSQPGVYFPGGECEHSEGNVNVDAIKPWKTIPYWHPYMNRWLMHDCKYYYNYYNCINTLPSGWPPTLQADSLPVEPQEKPRVIKKDDWKTVTRYSKAINSGKTVTRYSKAINSGTQLLCFL